MNVAQPELVQHICFLLILTGNETTSQCHLGRAPGTVRHPVERARLQAEPDPAIELADTGGGLRL